MFLDQLLHRVGADHQFVQTDAPLVAGAAAGIAIPAFARPVEGELPLVVGVSLQPGFVDRLGSRLGIAPEGFGMLQLLAVLGDEVPDFGRLGHIGLPAFGADALGEALREDAEQRVGEVERIHAHVEQADDRLRRAVGVQGGEHEVAGERGLDADAGGLGIAHFADHDDVRIGAQEGAHDHGEIEAGLLVDLHLAQPLLRDFDRILRRPDLRVGRVEHLQHRVQRGRLAGTGRAADEEEAVGLRHGRLEALLVVRQQAQLLQRDRLARGEDAHHHVLDAPRRRQRRHPQFDVERAELLELDLAVLRAPLFRDVQVAHDLDARDDGAAETVGNLDVLL